MEHIHIARRNPLFNLFAARRLTWWPELGVGFYPVENGAEPYNREYFERYQRQSGTPIGEALNHARVEFVKRHHDSWMVDIGIGSGAFISARDELTYGYDVNPAGVDWLSRRRLYWDIYRHVNPVVAISCWDVLEHIPEFDLLLAKVSKWVFVSIPIFQDCEHILRSKHYRKDEHMWYFTRRGLLTVFDASGFDCVEVNDEETVLGREGIESFAFKRRS